MLNRKNIITILLLVGLVAVVYLSITDRSQHGDKEVWMKEHGTVANRHADLDKFCIKCHSEKLGQTKENFCNKCHQQRNVKLIK